MKKLRTEEEIKHELENAKNWVYIGNSEQIKGFIKALEWVLGKSKDRLRKENL